MRKPDSLRAWLLGSVPGLATNPDHLHLFVDEGALGVRAGASLSYDHAYELTVMVEDFGVPSEHLFVPLLAWLSQHQRDVFDVDSDGIRIETDILDNTKCDYQIRLKLSEIAIVSTRTDGGWSVTFPELPPIDPCFEAPAEGAILWQIFLNGGLAAAHPDHLPAGMDAGDVLAGLPLPNPIPPPSTQPFAIAGNYPPNFPLVLGGFSDPGDLTLIFANHLI